MCVGVFLFVFILFGILWASRTWMSVSFLRLGKSSAIISSNNYSGPFSLSSPFGTPIMQMLFHLIMSQRSLKISPFLSFFFHFATHFHFHSAWVFLIALSSSLLIHASISSILLLNPLVYFSVPLQLLFGTCLCFLSLHWSSCGVHLFFFWDKWASLWPWLWTPYQVDCLLPLH